MKSKRKKQILFLLVVVFVLGIFPLGALAEGAPESACLHECGAVEICTGDPLTCPHADHEEGDCTAESTLPPSGAEEEESTSVAGSEANEDAKIIEHTVRFFASRADVAAGAPIATVSVANGATLAADAFPKAEVLGLDKSASVTWRMAADDAPLLPGSTVLAYDTATAVDVYAEVSRPAAAPSVAAAPAKNSSDYVVSGTVRLDTISKDNSVWRTADGSRCYLPGYTYSFDTETALVPYQYGWNRVEVKFMVTYGTARENGLKGPPSDKSVYVPQNCTIVLPGADIFGGALGAVTVTGWARSDKGENIGSTLAVGTSYIGLYGLLGSQPPPVSTYTVKFAVTPASGDWGTITPDLTGSSFTVKKGQALGALPGFTSPQAVVKDAAGYRTYFEGWYVNGVLLSSEPGYNFGAFATGADVTIQARFARYDLLPQDAQLVYKWEGAERTYDGTLQKYVDAEGTLYLRRNGTDTLFDPAEYGLSVTHLPASASGTDVKRDAQLEVAGYPMEWNGGIMLHQGGVNVTGKYGPIQYEAGTLVIKPVALTLNAQPATVKYDDAAALTFTMEGMIPSKFQTGNGAIADLSALFGMTGTAWLASGYDPATWAGAPGGFDIAFTTGALANTAVSASQTNYEVTLNDSLVSAGGGLTVTGAHMVTYYNLMADVTGRAPSAKPYAENATVQVKTGEDLLAHPQYVFTGWRTADGAEFYAAGTAGSFAMPAANVELYAVWAFADDAFALDVSGFGKEYDGIEAATKLSGPLEDGDIVIYTLRDGSTHSYIYGVDTPYEFLSADVVQESVTVTIRRPGVEPYVIDAVSVVIRQRPVEVYVVPETLPYTGEEQTSTPVVQADGLTGNMKVAGAAADVDATAAAVGTNVYDTDAQRQYSYGTYNFYLDGALIDAARNLAVTERTVSMVITPAQLTLTTLGAEEAYNGAALTKDAYSVAYGSSVFAGNVSGAPVSIAVNDGGKEWFEGHELTLDVTGVQAGVGDSENKYENLKIVKGSEDRTRNFAITPVYGTLRVTALTLTVTVYGNEGYYTGSPLAIQPDADGNLFEATGLLPGEQLSADSINEINSHLRALALTTIGTAGQNETMVTTFATNLLALADGKDIGNYTIVLNEGELVLKPRPITYISASASKVYDGAPLTAESVVVYDGAFTSAAQVTDAERIGNSVVSAYDYSDVTFDMAIAKLTGATDVQAAPLANSFVVGDILDSAGQVVTRNFEIHTVAGALAIAPRPVTLTAHSGGPFLADTTRYTVSGYDTERSTAANPDRGLLPGHVLSGISAEAEAYVPGTYPVTFSGSPVVTDPYARGGQNLAANYAFETVEGTMILQALPAGNGPEETADLPAGPAAPEEEGRAPESGTTAKVPAAESRMKAETVDSQAVPVAGPGSWGTADWGLANLLISVLSGALGALLLVSLLRRKIGTQGGKRSLVWCVLAVLAGVAAPVVFLVFDNRANPMVFANSLTVWMAAILILQVAAVLLLKLANRKKAGGEA